MNYIRNVQTGWRIIKGERVNLSERMAFASSGTKAVVAAMRGIDYAATLFCPEGDLLARWRLKILPSPEYVTDSPSNSGHKYLRTAALLSVLFLGGCGWPTGGRSGLLYPKEGGPENTDEKAFDSRIPDIGMPDSNKPCEKEAWTKVYKGPGCSGSSVSNIAVDIFGNVYVTGYEEENGKNVILVIKYDKYGKEIWANHFGSKNYADFSYDITTDPSGYVYIAGHTAASLINDDILVLKINPENGQELWSTQIKGPTDKNDVATGIIADKSGAVYITGSTNKSLKPLIYNILTCKLNSSDGAIIWQREFNDGEGVFEGEDIAIGPDNNINVVGTGYLNSNYLIKIDTFLIKYDPQGNKIWDRRYDVKRHEKAKSISVAPSGNIYITGSLDQYSLGTDNTWTAMFNSSGNHIWSKIEEGEGGHSITSDNMNNAYVISDSPHPSYMWVKKYNTIGDSTWYERLYIGGGKGIAVDQSQNVYFTGYFKPSGQLFGTSIVTGKINSCANK